MIVADPDSPMVEDQIKHRWIADSSKRDSKMPRNGKGMGSGTGRPLPSNNLCDETRDNGKVTHRDGHIQSDGAKDK